MKLNKIIYVIIFIFLMISILDSNVHAATMGMSISNTTAYVGENFTVTISGINGKVNITSNSNITIDKSGSQWVDGSLTITGTTKLVGTGTITVTPVDVTTTAAEPEEVTASASKSITIKEKETPKPSTTTPTTPTKPATTTSKPTTSTTTKTETPKKEDNFYITKLNLKGIKENSEQVDITLSPEFNKDVYEYSCNVSADVQKIEIEKDAGEYTQSIIVSGVEELKEGENIITLQLAAENHESKTYTIKVIKEKKEETKEVVAEVDEGAEKYDNEEQSGTIMVSLPLPIFVIMQIVIIAIEVLTIYFVPWRKIFKR